MAGSRSAFKVIEEDKLKSMDVATVQDLFRLYNVVVKNVTPPSSQWEWSRKCVARIGDMNAKYQIRGPDYNSIVLFAIKLLMKSFRSSSG